MSIHSIHHAVLQKFPVVHLYKIDISGHYIVDGSPYPRVLSDIDQPKPSKFQIIPLKKSPDGSYSVRELKKKFETQAEALEAMQNTDYVAILSCDESEFISCRRAVFLPKLGRFSLTEYRPSIDDYETFRIKYHTESGGFSFLTHNDLYLDCNRTFWTVASRGRPKSPDKTVALNRSWEIRFCDLI